MILTYFTVDKTYYCFNTTQANKMQQQLNNLCIMWLSIVSDLDSKTLNSIKKES